MSFEKFSWREGLLALALLVNGLSMLVLPELIPYLFFVEASVLAWVVLLGAYRAGYRKWVAGMVGVLIALPTATLLAVYVGGALLLLLAGGPVPTSRVTDAMLEVFSLSSATAAGVVLAGLPCIRWLKAHVRVSPPLMAAE